MTMCQRFLMNGRHHARARFAPLSGRCCAHLDLLSQLCASAYVHARRAIACGTAITVVIVVRIDSIGDWPVDVVVTA